MSVFVFPGVFLHMSCSACKSPKLGVRFFACGPSDFWKFAEWPLSHLKLSIPVLYRRSKWLQSRVKPMDIFFLHAPVRLPYFLMKANIELYLETR